MKFINYIDKINLCLFILILYFPKSIVTFNYDTKSSITQSSSTITSSNNLISNIQSSIQKEYLFNNLNNKANNSSNTDNSNSYSKNIYNNQPKVLTNYIDKLKSNIFLKLTPSFINKLSERFESFDNEERNKIKSNIRKKYNDVYGEYLHKVYNKTDNHDNFDDSVSKRKQKNFYLNKISKYILKHLAYPTKAYYFTSSKVFDNEKEMIENKELSSQVTKKIISSQSNKCINSNNSESNQNADEFIYNITRSYKDYNNKGKNDLNKREDNIHSTDINNINDINDLLFFLETDSNTKMKDIKNTNQDTNNTKSLKQLHKKHIKKNNNYENYGNSDNMGSNANNYPFKIAENNNLSNNNKQSDSLNDYLIKDKTSSNNTSAVTTLKHNLFGETEQIKEELRFLSGDYASKKRVIKFYISESNACNVYINDTVSYIQNQGTNFIEHMILHNNADLIEPKAVNSDDVIIQFFAFNKKLNIFSVYYDNKFYRTTDLNDINSNINNDKNDNTGNRDNNSNSNRNDDYGIKKSKLDSYSNDIKTELLEKKSRIISDDSDKSITISNNHDNNLSSNKMQLLNIFKNNINTYSDIVDNYTYNNSNSKNQNRLIRKQSNAQENINNFTIEYDYEAINLIKAKSMTPNNQNSTTILHNTHNTHNTPNSHTSNTSLEEMTETKLNSFIWKILNQNTMKSREAVKIELYFDVQKDNFEDSVSMNLPFSKTIFYIQDNNNNYKNDNVNANNNNGNGKRKIMKFEWEGNLEPQEVLILEVDFPYVFNRCVEIKANAFVCIIGAVFLVFIIGMLYIILSALFFEDF